MNKVKRFSLEERYDYQNRKVIYDKDADDDIELNNIYPIIDLLNQLDEQIADLQHRLEVAEKALNEMAKEKEANTYAKEIVFLDNKIKLLKQSQKQLAIEVLGKTREKFGYKYNSQLVISSKYLCDFIDNQIKELKGDAVV